jgi:hypothetical protein
MQEMSDCSIIELTLFDSLGTMQAEERRTERHRVHLS